MSPIGRISSLKLHIYDNAVCMGGRQPDKGLIGLSPHAKFA